MNDKNITLKAKLTSIHPLVTGNFSLIFKTEDISIEDKMSILYYHQKEGTLSFTEKEQDKQIKIKNISEQTRYQRIKAQLKAKYDIEDTTEPFIEWYNKQLDIIIKYIRDNKIL